MHGWHRMKSAHRAKSAVNIPTVLTKTLYKAREVDDAPPHKATNDHGAKKLLSVARRHTQ